MRRTLGGMEEGVYCRWESLAYAGRSQWGTKWRVVGAVSLRGKKCFMTDVRIADACC